jgi:osmotically inducible protein OsmC
MAIAVRTARTTWEGPLASGTGTIRTGSGAAGELAVSAIVTLDEADGVPTIVSSHLDVTARIPGLDQAAFDAVIGEASALCPVSRLFAGAKITVNAALEAAG